MAKIIDFKTRRVLANLPSVCKGRLPDRKLWRTSIPSSGCPVFILSNTELEAFKRQDAILAELKRPFSLKLVSNG